jgi:hypothetical protein
MNGDCGCGCEGGYGMRNFLTKEEKLEILKEYKKNLEEEAKGVEERIKAIEKKN